MKPILLSLTASNICKWLFLVLTGIVGTFPTQAQTITDNAFAVAIREVCPTCIDDANKLLFPATSLTSLDISNKGISDLTGIGGFTSLKSLNCHSNKLTQLPTLPSTLTTLQCDVNQITSLPTLPAGLTTLSCSYNQLPFLPTLPTTLTALACNNNQLTNLPDLPNTLTSLTCSSNQLAALPNALPAGLKTLFCLSNKLTQLPTLPNSLTTLYCQENQISCLPALPSSLSVLYLDTDKISCLPTVVSGLKVYNARGNLAEEMGICVKIPDPKFADAIRSSCPQCVDQCGNLTPAASTVQYLYLQNKDIVSISGIEQFSSLQTLYCGRNKLKTIPDNLPASLRELNIDYNELSTLPKLPTGITSLNCSNNKITSIQDLPTSLTTFYCNQNQLVQLTNLPSGLTYLNCYGNFLTSLPALPSNLITLLANNNKLASLPSLPEKLQQIEIAFNLLSKLPQLPSQLYTLICNNNNLECLPTLPPNISTLNIANTNITCIPNKPSNIYIISNGVNISTCGFSDPNLTASIKQTCSSCFDECGRPNPSEISKIKTLDLSNKNISNISEIELFTSLESLNLSHNPLIKCISFLPASLTSLTIDTTTIRCLPPSLSSLKVYSASGGILVNFPICVTIKDVQFASSIRSSCSNCLNECNQLMPASSTLKSLSCFNVKDLSHIENFSSLDEFTCYGCEGSELPKFPENLKKLRWTSGFLLKTSNLPTNLFSLNLSNNKITQIESLPTSLNDFDISYNQLVTIKGLPNSIKTLNIEYNQIQEIENLPSELTILTCDNNQIKSLPSLPKNLQFLNCGYNKLTSLPELPNNLVRLYCGNNFDLACLPLLPNSLKELIIVGNSKIACLPNKVSLHYFVNNGNSSLPLCGLADINLVKSIQGQCPTCFDACFNLNKSEAEKIKIIDLTNKPIVSLNGIELFSNLETLILADIPTNCITALPNSLTSLTIDPEKITCLPAHNASLKVYNSANQLIPTPPQCTNRISDLNFADAIRRNCPTCIDECNQLLPPANQLGSLSIAYSNIKDITGISKFSSLKSLTVSNNLLTFLPELPALLSYIDVSNNLLTRISNLPSKITTLICSFNKISKIDSLPSQLQSIECNNNELEFIPTLPENLQTLALNNNLPLKCLPFLPQRLQSLYIVNSPLVTCLPNKPSNLYISREGNNPINLCGLPNENLQKAVQSICPTCFDECSKLIMSEANKITVLNLSNVNLSSLVGIEAFKNLDSLVIANNSIACLPILPSNINSITIDSSKIRCINSLNSNLRVYASNGKRITKPTSCGIYIPDINFANAIRRSCSNCIDDCNYLLPPAASLTSLSITYSNITDLTGIEGFATLQSLYASGNLLKTLPTLPSTLRTLEVRANALQSIPSLPDNITELYISNNSLTQLPTLPNRLQRLDLINNKISAIPTLPSTLIDLRCSSNQITCLPSIPFSLTYLQFDSHKIGCLKNLKSGISLIGYNNASFTTYSECSNPIILSDVTANIPNPVTPSTTVSLTVKRNYTGTVAIKWQRKKLSDSDYSDLKIDTIATATNADFVYTIPNVTVADNGSEYRLVVTSACSGTFTAKAFTLMVKDESLSPPTITASPRDTVCLSQTIRLTSSCPPTSATLWSTGENAPFIDIHSSTQTSRTFTAKCSTGAIQSPESPVKTVVWKPFEVILINIGQSKSATKQGQNVSLSAWNSQFVTPDNGPSLAFSSQTNPSIYYLDNPNKIQPRFWTAYVDICDVSNEGSVSFDMLTTPEIGIPVSFNTHENNAPYFMYANRDGFTELYAQNHPNFGFYAENENKQNRYDDGLPAGLYKLSIRYWPQKGLGLAPSLRFPQGISTSYQEHWFRIQSKMRTSSARRSVDSSPDAPLFSITPNPATTTAVLSVKQAKHQEIQYEWVDVTGRVHHKSQFVAETDNHTEQLNITRLPTGLYFLRITTPTQQVNLKVTKLD